MGAFYVFILFSPSECPGLCQHRSGHSRRKKGLTDRAKPSKVAGSFYAMVFMAPSICSSIEFVNNLFLNIVSMYSVYHCMFTSYKILTTETIFCLCEAEIKKINLNKFKKAFNCTWFHPLSVLETVQLLWGLHWHANDNSIISRCPTFCLNHKKNQLYIKLFPIFPYSMKTWNIVVAKFKTQLGKLLFFFFNADSNKENKSFSCIVSLIKSWVW